MQAHSSKNFTKSTPNILKDYAAGALENPLALTGHTSRVNCLTVLLDGKLASGSSDDTIKIWGARQGKYEAILTGHKSEVKCLTMLPDGRLASGSNDTTIKIWDVKQGKCEATLTGHTHWVFCLTVLPDGKLASCSYDTTIKIWDVKQGKCEATLTEHTDLVSYLTVLPDYRLASGSRDKTIKIWDAEKGKCETTLTGHTNVVSCLTVLPDGRLASGSHDETIKIWDVKQGKCEATLTAGDTSWVNCLTVLPNGRLASSGSHIIQIWDVGQGKCEATMTGPPSHVYCLTVLPDGRLASGSDDTTIKIWDFPALAPMLLPATTPSPIATVEIKPPLDTAPTDAENAAKEKELRLAAEAQMETEKTARQKAEMLAAEQERLRLAFEAEMKAQLDALHTQAENEKTQFTARIAQAEKTEQVEKAHARIQEEAAQKEKMVHLAEMAELRRELEALKAAKTAQDKLPQPSVPDTLPPIDNDQRSQLGIGSPQQQAARLLEAVLSGDEEMVINCITQGISNSSAESVLPFSPLWAAVQNGHLKIVQYLIEHSANTDFVHPVHGTNVLMLAAYQKHLPVLSYLLSLKTFQQKINDARSDGVTALYLAAQEGFTEGVQQLLAWGADASRRREHGVTILHAAAMGNHAAIINLLQPFHLHQQADAHGNLPIHLAAQGQTRAMLTLLRHHPNSINEVKPHGVNVLHIAAFNGQQAMIKLLLSFVSTLNPDTATAEGETPCQLASRQGHAEIVTLLNEQSKQQKQFDLLINLQLPQIPEFDELGIDTPSVVSRASSTPFASPLSSGLGQPTPTECLLSPWEKIIIPVEGKTQQEKNDHTQQLFQSLLEALQKTQPEKSSAADGQAAEQKQKQLEMEWQLAKRQLELALAEANTKIAHTQTELEKTKQENQTAREKIEALEEKSKTKGQEYAKLQHGLGDIKNQLNQLLKMEIENKTSTPGNTELNAQLTDLKQRQLLLTQRCGGLEKDYKTLQYELAIMQTQKEAAEKEQALLQKQLNNYQQQQIQCYQQKTLSARQTEEITRFTHPASTVKVRENLSQVITNTPATPHAEQENVLDLLRIIMVQMQEQRKEFQESSRVQQEMLHQQQVMLAAQQIENRAMQTELHALRQVLSTAVENTAQSSQRSGQFFSMAVHRRNTL
jgi:WD40 repeat protein/ankyrin repeat protein